MRRGACTAFFGKRPRHRYDRFNHQSPVWLAGDLAVFKDGRESTKGLVTLNARRLPRFASTNVKVVLVKALPMDNLMAVQIKGKLNSCQMLRALHKSYST